MNQNVDEPFEQPDLLLMLHEAMPNDIESNFRQNLPFSGMKIAVRRHPNGPYAGIELYLPTAIALFVTAGFFNGFLQEAGKDAYAAFKRAAIELWQRSRCARVSMIGTKGKVSCNQRYSLAYSITGAVLPGLNFKLVIRTDLEQEASEAGIVAFLDLIDDLLQDRLGEPDVQALLAYRPVGGTVVVTFDADQRKIIPVNALEYDGE